MVLLVLASPVVSVFVRCYLPLSNVCHISVSFACCLLAVDFMLPPAVSSLSSKTVGLLHQQQGVNAVMAPSLEAVAGSG